MFIFPPPREFIEATGNSSVDLDSRQYLKAIFRPLGLLRLMLNHQLAVISYYHMKLYLFEVIILTTNFLLNPLLYCRHN